MILVYIVAGLVLGFCIFLFLKRRYERQEKVVDLETVKIACPYCQSLFDAGPAWKRHGLRGDFFACSTCGRESIWDLDTKPPTLRFPRPPHGHG